MSTAAERLATVQENYDQAADNQAKDLAKAKDEVEVAAVQANVGAARLAYYKAEADELSKAGADVEQAQQEAKDALAAVKKARQDVEKLATLLGKLSKATEKAANLVEKAKKAIG